LEVAIGASFAGYRSFAVMKTVGLHVAADALGGAAGSQINGGLVLVVGDDVGVLQATIIMMYVIMEICSIFLFWSQVTVRKQRIL
jgi:hypothetical protein